VLSPARAIPGDNGQSPGQHFAAGAKGSVGTGEELFEGAG
jgi:hypothetical protein